MQHIDFSALQQQVMNRWDAIGLGYSRIENVGFPAPGPTKDDVVFEPWAERILDSIDLCLLELGFDSISQWIADCSQRKLPGHSLSLYEAILFEGKGNYARN